MSRLRPTHFLLVGATSVVLTACGGSSAAPGDATDADFADADATVVAEDVAFVDPPTTLPAGTQVIGLDNQGDARHDIAFEGDIGLVTAAPGGEQAAGEVTLEPGNYVVYCSVSGHRQAGMEFELTVE